MKRLTRAEVWRELHNKKLKIYKKTQLKKMKNQIKRKKQDQKQREKDRKKRFKRMNSRIDKTVSALVILLFGCFAAADTLAEKKKAEAQKEAKKGKESGEIG